MANDTDPESGTMLSVTTASNGTVTLGNDGTLTDTPNAGFSGSDSFDLHGVGRDRHRYRDSDHHRQGGVTTTRCGRAPGGGAADKLTSKAPVGPQIPSAPYGLGLPPHGTPYVGGEESAHSCLSWLTKRGGAVPASPWSWVSRVSARHLSSTR